MLGLGALLTPLALFRRVRPLTALCFWAIGAYMLLDFFVFRIYKFHITLLILEMFIFDFQGVGAPPLVLLAGAASLAGLMFLAFYALRRSGRASPLPALSAPGKLCLGIFLPLYLLNSGLHIWGAYYEREEITAYDYYFPAYYPMLSTAFMRQLSAAFPDIFPERNAQAPERNAQAPERNAQAPERNAQNEGGLQARFPLESLRYDPEARQDSIALIVLESWQADSLRPEIMPALSAFAESGTLFTRHLSSGAATVHGLFGLMYGAHPTFYDFVKNTPSAFPAPLTEELHKAGYSLNVFTTGSLERFNLRSLFFSRVLPERWHEEDKDSALVGRFRAALQEAAPEEKRFDFVFLTSSHSPYYYPPAYTRFTPLPALKGGYVFNPSGNDPAYKNDYHNSLFYLDSLLAEIFAALREQGRLDKTWIVVTGDHAEEFNESGLGLWGHGSSFNRWQTQVPLLLKAPGQTQGRVESRLSLHQDIAPTLLQEALGCLSPPAAYSDGVCLLRLPESRGSVLASYSASAWYFNDIIVEKGSRSQYRWSNPADKEVSFPQEEMRRLLLEERHFFRK